MKGSIYEAIFPEDSKQYRSLAARYLKLTTVDYTSAFDITQRAWALAQRWSDIQSNVAQIATERGISKTDLRDWAYQRYRQLQLMHEHARMIWKLGEDEMRYERRLDKGAIV
jgi:hypothetical protein